MKFNTYRFYSNTRRYTLKSDAKKDDLKQIVFYTQIFFNRATIATFKREIEKRGFKTKLCDTENVKQIKGVFSY